jgi:rubrerythrin
MDSTRKKKQGKPQPARTRRTPAKRSAIRSVKHSGKTARPASAARSRAAVDQFYADALAIEVEASARYRVLAREMQASDNPRTAELFLKLAQLESGHADKLRNGAAAAAMPPRARDGLLSRKAGQTEVPNYQFLYRNVPPYHALLMALESERRAKAYFERIRANTPDPEVKKLAAEFARDEDRHVAWLEKALAKEPQPATPSTDFSS